MYPTVAGAVVPIYNLGPVNDTGTDGLMLTPLVLTRIFRGNITTWDDPQIVELQLQGKWASYRIPPGQPIEVVVRADKSGTTEVRWTLGE